MVCALCLKPFGTAKLVCADPETMFLDVILRSPANGGTTKNLEILRGVYPERLDLRTSSEPPFGPSLSAVSSRSNCSRPRAVELLADTSRRRAQTDIGELPEGHYLTPNWLKGLGPRDCDERIG
jgi:hypothetical protein